MSRLTVWVFLLALGAFPIVVVGATDNDPRIDHQLHEKRDKKEKKPKGVPEPATMLLVGAAAVTFVGVRKLLKRKDR